MKFLLFKPPWSKQAPGLSHSPAWLSPKNPAADPAPQPRLQPPCPHAGPSAGPKDLIVLKHYSYRLISQCPLSLVSDLHICWSTIGCLLCSSDQLGVSLVPRESGLCSHLSHHHLPRSHGSCFLIHSTILCLLIGAFNPFPFKVTTNMYLFIAIFSYLCSSLFLFSFLSFKQSL